MKLKNAITAYRVFLTAAVFLALLGYALRTLFLLYMAFICAFAVIIITLMMLKCPHCKKNLGAMVLIRKITHCPYCHRELD